VALVLGLSLVVPAVVIDAWRHRPEIFDQSDYPVPPPDDPSWDRVSVFRLSALPEESDASDEEERDESHRLDRPRVLQAAEEEER
jgi:hypothetical protein